MDSKEVEKLVEKYAKLVVQEYPAEFVVLFGSYAKGTDHTHSDIDVAVVVNHIEGDYHQSLTRLFRIGEEVHVLIEHVLIGKDEYRGGFLEEIMKTGKVIYQRNQASA
jgi:predicted nucleotidyltransferase